LCISIKEKLIFLLNLQWNPAKRAAYIKLEERYREQQLANMIAAAPPAPSATTPTNSSTGSGKHRPQSSGSESVPAPPASPGGGSSSTSNSGGMGSLSTPAGGASTGGSRSRTYSSNASNTMSARVRADSHVPPSTPTSTTTAASAATPAATATTNYDSRYYHCQVKDEHISSNNFAYLPDARVVISCGHWDRSIRITTVDTHKLLYSLIQHKDIVTCLQIVQDYGSIWLITGSRDCTLIVWEILVDKVKQTITSITQIRTLFGHDDSISCIASNAELDLIASGSDDGTIILHNLRDGKYIRSIVNAEMRCHWDVTAFPNTVISGDFMTATSNTGAASRSQDGNDDASVSTATTTATNTTTSTATTTITVTPPKETWKVSWIGISQEGYLVTYCAEKRRLVTFSLNGGFICTKKIQETLYSLLFSQDGMVLLTGGSSCLVVLRWVSLLLFPPASWVVISNVIFFSMHNIDS
jgi:hypothetical protein